LFPSAIGEYRDRNITDTHGADDIVFEYNGRKGFAGTLAELESEFSGSIMGDTKAHDDAKLRILIACHRMTQEFSPTFRLVVGQPIAKHVPGEKEAIREMLIGEHEVVVNSKRKFITIEDVRVAAEGGAAFWSAPRNGLVRLIDVGSATVNCATLKNCRYVDRDSFTLPFGVNTVKSNDLTALARGIVTHTSKKWQSQDFVYVLGGIAETLTGYLREYYPSATELIPTFDGEPQRPIFANAIGFYQIARGVYGEGNR
jgi:plasmid segregation protein ParM